MKVGIVGVSGFGGGELLRLVLGHPTFELAYAAGESTAGQKLSQRFPALAGRLATTSLTSGALGDGSTWNRVIASYTAPPGDEDAVMG